VSEPRSSPGRRAASTYLRELLQRPGAYRWQWEQHVVRSRPGEINHLAVAEVLARYLWSYPRVAGEADVLPHQLKDTVGRALSGRLLSRSALSLFIDAFSVSGPEADRLRRLWEGSGTVTVLSGPRAVTPRTEQELEAAIGPRRHRTLSLHDHVTVGADGRLASTRVLQVIEALADQVDRIPFLYDTTALTLEVGQGCTASTGELRQVSEDLYVTHILLAGVLDTGQTTTLEYRVTYHYDADPADPDQRLYRRAVMGRLENFDMRVEFHPSRTPAGVWWATWDGVDGGILQRERVTPDAQGSVHRYLRFVEKTVAGFCWDW
jgi:hypothetical protein